MPWPEFCTLLSGLMADTPLGQVVTIRCEKDPKTIKAFTPDQRKIHRDWQLHLAQKKLANPETLDKEFTALTQALERMFSKPK